MQPKNGPPWRVEMLGALRVKHPGEGLKVSRFRTHKTAALLAYLAFHPGPHPRELLIDVVWPDASLETGRNNLRVALSSLRQVLRLSEDTNETLLEADRKVVGLRAPNVSSDVAEFEALLHAATKATGAGRLQQLERAVELYRGPLLPGFYEDWVSVQASRLDDLFFRALDTLVAALEREEQFERALELADRGARFDANRLETRRDLQRLRARLRTPHAAETVTSESTPSHEIELPKPRPVSLLPLLLTRFFSIRLCGW